MSEIKAILLDMDGVVTNTEIQYEVYWVRLQTKYGLEMDDFITHVKGKRLKDIVTGFFSYLPREGQQNVARDIKYFEMNEMEYHPISGVDTFIKQLKEKNYKIALVTSSIREKTEKALQDMKLVTYFDAVVTADDVEEGKPNPQCYILGAEKLNMKPTECLVFEDALSGIEAATKAGMRSVGVSTSFSEEELKKKVPCVIPDFTNITIEQILEKY